MSKGHSSNNTSSDKTSKEKSKKNIQKPSIEEDYEALLEELYSPGEWNRAPLVFGLIMPCDHAWFMGYLMGLSRQYRAHKNGDGFFFHTHEQIEQEFYLPRWKQDRLFDGLRQDGIITTERRGIPAKRHIKINYALIRSKILEKRKEHDEKFQPQQVAAVPLQLDATDPLQLVVTDPLQHSSNNTESNQKIKKQNHSRSSKTREGVKGFFPDDEHDKPSIWVNKLYKILDHHKKVIKRPNLRDWKKQFKELQEFRTDNEITTMLEWYIQNIDIPYVPKCYSAKSFKEKFVNLEDSKKRQEEESHKQMNIKEGKRTSRSELNDDQIS